MNCGSSTSSWKPWRKVRLDLILIMRDIYINFNLNPLTKCTRSRCTGFKDILSQNVSQIITKIIPISTRIVISNAMKRGILVWIWQKVDGNWDNNMIKFLNGRKTIIEQILVSEERNKSKKAGLWEPQSEIRLGKLTIWVRSFEIKNNYNRVHQVYQFHQSRLASPYDGHLIIQRQTH